MELESTEDLHEFNGIKLNPNSQQNNDPKQSKEEQFSDRKRISQPTRRWSILTKMLELLYKHKDILFRKGIENEDSKEFKKDDYYNTVFIPFLKEIGDLKKYPYIKDIFKTAVIEMKRKKYKKKEDFWKIWLKKQTIKPKLNFVDNTCELNVCGEGKLPNLEQLFKSMEKTFLRNYPDIHTGRRKVTMRKNDFGNLKYMCSHSDIEDSFEDEQEPTTSKSLLRSIEYNTLKNILKKKKSEETWLHQGKILEVHHTEFWFGKCYCPMDAKRKLKVTTMDSVQTVNPNIKKQNLVYRQLLQSIAKKYKEQEEVRLLLENQNEICYPVATSSPNSIFSM